jgi:hypothetical protein
VIADFDEGAERGEREGEPAADVEAGAAFGFRYGDGADRRLDSGIVVADAADQVGHAETDDAVHRAADDAGVAADVVLVVEPVVCGLDPGTDRDERRAEVEAERAVEARLILVGQVADRQGEAAGEADGLGVRDGGSGGEQARHEYGQ